MDRPRGVGEVTLKVTMRGHHSFFFLKKSSFVKQSYLMGFRDSQSFFLFFFWPQHTACRILVPQLGIEPHNPCSGSSES